MGLWESTLFWTNHLRRSCWSSIRWERQTRCPRCCFRITELSFEVGRRTAEAGETASMSHLLYYTQKIWGSKTCQKFVILTSFGSSFRWCPKRRVYVCQDEFLWQNLSKGRQVEQSNICQFQIIFIYFPKKTPKRTQ